MKLEPLIYVTNLKQSVDSYTEVLGFRLGQYFPDNNNPTYAPMFVGENKLMLVLARESNKSFILTVWEVLERSFLFRLMM